MVGIILYYGLLDEKDRDLVGVFLVTASLLARPTWGGCVGDECGFEVRGCEEYGKEMCGCEVCGWEVWGLDGLKVSVWITGLVTDLACVGKDCSPPSVLSAINKKHHSNTLQ